MGQRLPACRPGLLTYGYAASTYGYAGGGGGGSVEEASEVSGDVVPRYSRATKKSRAVHGGNWANMDISRDI